ncbi:jacalin-like lectin [Methanococcus maripaludis]|uniref:Jacalin-type lectin domain-containing protein n=2 Tax=Methanococcus maripaludis TaxID=39152 RepID=A0A7J9PEV5_METMI|nr:hypothetical protein [Methanococcus maripaludis]MBA2861792.1 hypothetical protein [Methanococcus maripaludis]
MGNKSLGIKLQKFSPILDRDWEKYNKINQGVNMTIYEPTQYAGHGGHPFRQFGNDCSVIHSIRVWIDSLDKHRIIKALEVTFTDGITTKMCGESHGNVHTEYVFKPGEKIESMSLWDCGNPKKLRAGRILFKTSNGITVDTGKCKGKTEFPVNVGSGILVGIEGGSGADVDRIGFIFIKPIKEMILENVIYPTLKFETTGIMPVYLDEYLGHNTSDHTISWKFGDSINKTFEHTWSSTSNVELFGEYSVKAGVPEVVEVDGKYGWKVGAETRLERSEKESKELNWDTEGTLEPGESINLVAITRRGSLPGIDMSGDLKIVTKDGESKSFKMTGLYNGITYTQVETCSKNEKL